MDAQKLGSSPTVSSGSLSVQIKQSRNVTCLQGMHIESSHTGTHIIGGVKAEVGV